MIRAAVLALFLGGSALAATAPVPPLPTVTATLSGAPAVIYDWKRDSCSFNDIEDSSARAFRDSAGAVHLFVVGPEAYANVGPDMAHLKHGCQPVMNSAFSHTPWSFADHSWLASTYTVDGRTIYGLVHTEFHPLEGAPPWFCSSNDVLKCVYVSFMAATSTNGGSTFTVQPPPVGVVVTSPYEYAPNAGRVGYMNPSNMMTLGRFQYVVFVALPFKDQKGGLCLMRTATPAVPSSWRAWDGTGFNVAFADPYTDPRLAPANSVCDPLGPDLTNLDSPSLIQHTSDGTFILVGQQGAGARHPGDPRFLAPAASTSRDLIHWSKAKPLLTPQDETKLGSTHYPVLLDPASTDRNFATAGNVVNLLYVIYNTATGNIRDRDLFQISAALHVSP